MGRSPYHDKEGLKKGPWTPEEDQKLLAYIDQHGFGSWSDLPAKAGLMRCGRSCRLRWINYLRPDIKRGKFSSEEERTIIQLHALLGNKWSAIAAFLRNRSDNEIKNYWNTRLKKRLVKMGIDPMTHKPKRDSNSNNDASLSHMAEWETARLEAEARHTYNNHKYSQPRRSNYNFQQQRFPCLDILKAWQIMSPSKPTINHHIISSVPSIGTIERRLTSSLYSDATNKWRNALNDDISTNNLNKSPTQSTMENMLNINHGENNLCLPTVSCVELEDLCPYEDIKITEEAGADSGFSFGLADQLFQGYDCTQNHANYSSGDSLLDTKEPYLVDDNKSNLDNLLYLVTSPIASPLFHHDVLG